VKPLTPRTISRWMPMRSSPETLRETVGPT
jgi:hypothetical protein